MYGMRDHHSGMCVTTTRRRDEADTELFGSLDPSDCTSDPLSTMVPPSIRPPDGWSHQIPPTPSPGASPVAASPTGGVWRMPKVNQRHRMIEAQTIQISTHSSVNLKEYDPDMELSSLSPSTSSTSSCPSCSTRSILLCSVLAMLFIGLVLFHQIGLPSAITRQSDIANIMQMQVDRHIELTRERLPSDALEASIGTTTLEIETPVPLEASITHETSSKEAVAHLPIKPTPSPAPVKPVPVAPIATPPAKPTTATAAAPPAKPAAATTVLAPSKDPLPVKVEFAQGEPPIPAKYVTESFAAVQKGHPALYPILKANSIDLGTFSAADDVAALKRYADYMADTSKKLSGAGLRFLPWQNPGKSPAVTSVPEGMQTTSALRTYATQVLENVCVSFEQSRHATIFIIEDSKQELSAAITARNTAQTKPQWLPFRYNNEQWFWKSLPKDQIGKDWKFVKGATLSQLTWDKNVGHQFHHAVFPMYMAMHSHPSFNLPPISHFLLNSGCTSMTPSTQIPTSPLFYQVTDPWFSVTTLLARIAVGTMSRQMDLLQSDCVDRSGEMVKDATKVVCFEKLVLPDIDDVYMRNEFSAEGIRTFRSAVIAALALPSAPSRLPAAPLRITIYTRVDSSRRRLLNGEHIRRVLGGTHIVRVIDRWGTQDPIQQFSLLANTDVLIAPHGAHMTFTFLMPPNSLVLEYHSARPAATWIKTMVAAVKIRHLEMYGVPDTTVATPKDWRPMDYDFRVNLIELCETLKKEYKITGCTQ